jgi:lauroyl/myristoyl acyltransferase
MVMQRIMSWLEGIIRRYPDQWFMFRHMWPSPSTVDSIL